MMSTIYKLRDDSYARLGLKPRISYYEYLELDTLETYMYERIKTPCENHDTEDEFASDYKFNNNDQESEEEIKVELYGIKNKGTS